MTLVTFSVEEVAEAVGKGPEWVMRRLKGFTHLKVGRTPRFTPEQAEAFVQSFTIRPGNDSPDDDGEDPLRSNVTRGRK